MFSRRAVLGGAAAGGSFALLSTSAARGAPQIGRTLAGGLVIPWGLAFLPDGDALVTTRESGEVFRVSRLGGKTLVGSIPCAGALEGEGGLLGVALSPTFGTDRLAYFYRTFSGENQVVRAQYDAGALSDLTVLLDGIAAGRIHNGGRLAFGPDGKLYVTTGETGEGARAQDKQDLAGKILRINADGTVPGDNPFGNEVWTWGHRNVQGIAWDRRGRMWATELGQSTRDELNRIVKGHNYGWPDVEGGDGPGPFHDPFVTWSPTSTCSPSGLAVTRDRAWVAALNGDCLWSVELFGSNRRRKRRHFHNVLGRLRAVETAPDGSLWVTTSNDSSAPGTDKVVRIVL